MTLVSFRLKTREVSCYWDEDTSSTMLFPPLKISFQNFTLLIGDFNWCVFYNLAPSYFQMKDIYCSKFPSKVRNKAVLIACSLRKPAWYAISIISVVACIYRLFMCQDENEPNDESFSSFWIKPVMNEPGLSTTIQESVRSSCMGSRTNQSFGFCIRRFCFRLGTWTDYYQK